MTGRVIDYALARGFDAVRVHNTGRRYGSDHDLVEFLVDVGDQEARIGLWNAQRDRDPAEVADLVDGILETRDLDVLLLCEAGDYVEALRRAQHTAPWRVLAADLRPGQHETAIVLRDYLPFSEFYAPLAARAGWFTVRGGKTPPKYLATVAVRLGAGAWVRLAVGHRAPSCSWRRGVLVGPPRRVLSTIRHARAEARLAASWLGPLLLAEDWNATPADRGRWSPHWVARTAGLDVVAPARGTHG